MNSGSLFASLKKFFRKRSVQILAGLIVLILIIIGLVKAGSTGAAQETYIVKRATVEEGVSVSGKVKASTAVNLSVEESGKVARITKKPGETVAANEVILELDAADLRARLAEAQAGVKIQRAKLAELEMGSRPEELKVSQVKVTNAETDVRTAENTLLTELKSAYTSADDAVRNKVDQMFINPRTSYPRLAFSATAGSERGIESGRIEVETQLTLLKPRLARATTTDNLIQLSDDVKQDLAEIKLFLDNLAFTLNAVKTDGNSEENITTWKTDLAAARTEVNTAITNILAVEQRLKTSYATLTVSESEYKLKQSGTLKEQVRAQEAEVARAEASVATVYADISKTIIRSPINGIVSRQDAELGQTLTPQDQAVSVMSNMQFEIEANIAEADIAKVAVGQKAMVTLDAYGSDVVFNATIVAVEPAETIIDGVPTYKTTFQFDSPDPRIKSGMTSNIDIEGRKVENALAVPQRALQSKFGKKYARVQEGESERQVNVRVGIRGVDGMVEIVEGLAEGDVVIVSQSQP